MGYDEVFIPFAVAAITPLGCAWVASRFVPPTNKWIYSGVIVGTAYLSWKYIVPRMLTSMGYPVPFEAESFSADKKTEICSLHKYEHLHDATMDGREVSLHQCSGCGTQIGKVKGRALTFVHRIGWDAESKFIRPYDGKYGIKLERDNKGRYRRKLSVPLKKSAEWERLTTTLSEISAKRSMASMKGKAHNSPKYLGVKKVDWKVAPYDEVASDEVWGVFRKLS